MAKLYCSKYRLSLPAAETEAIETLLEKAERYRRCYPQRWEKRKQEMRQALLISLGMYQPSPFLVEYYRKLDAIRAGEISESEDEIKTHPQLKVRVTYSPLEAVVLFTKKQRRESRKKKKQSVYNANAASAYGTVKELVSETSSKTELVIDIIEGLHVARQGATKHCVRVNLVPPEMQPRGRYMQTAFILPNAYEKHKWNHTFVFRGFATSQLTSRCFVLEIRENKFPQSAWVGEVVLKGERQGKSASEEGDDILATALLNPGITIEKILDVSRKKRKTKSVSSDGK